MPVRLKLEHWQTTGSFKLRGALNAIAALTEEQKRAGVVGVSTGNHGKGLAYAAKASGVRCIVCMSAKVPQNKVDGIRSLGAEVRIVGTSQDEAQIEVDRLVDEESMTLVPPFDHPDIIAGQGTIGLEVLDEAPNASVVVIPISGGGLASGMAVALKSQAPNVRIVGVSMERGPVMFESLKAGKPIEVPELRTLADSLSGGIGLANQFTFGIVRDLIDDFVLVSETEIAQAIRHAYWEERQIVEGSGSSALAAVLAGKVPGKGPIVVLMSGGNIDMSLHHRIISGEDVDVEADNGECL